MVDRIIHGERLSQVVSHSKEDIQDLRLFQNACYIVCGIAIEGGRVLMMQEAKRSCRGAWYLPTGRLEKEETLEEGVMREVLEETGLQFKPKSLICIEVQTSYTLWIRFTFFGDIVGGRLKTPDTADEESLQAGWYPSDPAKLGRTLQLRAGDILPLIDIANQWMERDRHAMSYSRLPQVIKQAMFSVSLLVIQKDSDKVAWLSTQDKDGKQSLPSQTFRYQMLRSASVTNHIFEMLQKEGVVGNPKDVQIEGILALEHSGKEQANGLHITLLVEVPYSKGKGQWVPLEAGEQSDWITKAKGGIKFKDLNHIA